MALAEGVDGHERILLWRDEKLLARRDLMTSVCAVTRQGLRPGLRSLGGGGRGESAG